MRYLTLKEVLVLHERLIAIPGGSRGIRDLNTLESALAQPMITFDGKDGHLSYIQHVIEKQIMRVVRFIFFVVRLLKKYWKMIPRFVEGNFGTEKNLKQNY